jgi:hypothetical protein
VYAQVNDAGLWMSINAEKKITPAFIVSLSQELRFSENITLLGSYYSDAGIAYKINKNIHFSVNYRYINKRKKDFSYNMRHRYYFDLSIRKKIKPVALQFRSRFQGQYNKIYEISDSDEPSYYIRNKLTIKIDLDKNYIPFIYSEISTTLNNPGGNYLDMVKYCAGVEYRINRMQGIELFYLFQRQYNVENPVSDFIIGIEYNWSF